MFLVNMLKLKNHISYITAIFITKKKSGKHT